MAKKNTYNELLEKFKQYVEKESGKIADYSNSIEDCEKELSKIQKDLNENSTMTAEESRSLTRKMNDLFGDLGFYKARLENIKKDPILTDEEYRAFKEEYRAYDEDLRNKCKEETYMILKNLVEYYEETITQIEKNRQLFTSFEYTVAKHKYSGCIAKSIPPYACAVIRLLLIYYNELDKELNEGKKQTECFNRTEIRDNAHVIQDIMKKVDDNFIADMSVPSFQEAYKELKYNKNWEV